MKFVYSFDSSAQKDLKKIVDAEPYADDSFARAGFQLKDGKTLGLEEGKTYLYFSVEDQTLGGKLKAKLEEAKIESLKEVEGEEKDKIVSSIESEGESAAEGFGSIFG